MVKAWKATKISDIVEFNPRESLPKGKIAKKIAMENIQPFIRDIPKFQIAPFLGGTKFRNGDTLMARITPCLENGKTAQVSILDENEVGFGSTEFIVLRAKPHISDKNFVYYLALSPALRDKAIKSMVGSSGRQRVQQSVLEDTEILAPSLQEQISIGSILKILDDKIALNCRINDYLASLRSATDSLPDIKRGKRVSRRATNVSLSARFFAICCRTPERRSIIIDCSATGGKTSFSFLKSFKTIRGSAEPETKLSRIVC